MPLSPMQCHAYLDTMHANSHMYDATIPQCKNVCDCYQLTFVCTVHVGMILNDSCQQPIGLLLILLCMHTAYICKLAIGINHNLFYRIGWGAVWTDGDAWSGMKVN